MHHDSQTVPVVVTVHVRPHAPASHQPGSSLPFTGSPLEALTCWGVAITVVGAAVVTTARRRRTPRSYS
ncbi:MAG TPA: hypothetical protein VFH66_09830 [Mycobacteriales bacterium]|nr:hypothetical protein [Mycobacteriales bacterium]